jgi:hypothetical protein
MSVSRMEIQLHDDRADIQLQVQVLSLKEVPHLKLDADLDDHVSDKELLSAWGRTQEYLNEGIALRFNQEIFNPNFVNWERRREEFDWFVVNASLPLESFPKEVGISTTLFFEDGNPAHRMSVRMVGFAGEALETLLSQEHSADDFQSHPFQDYLSFGFHHVLEGWDHLAFLAALLFGIAGLGSLLGAVTAFTLAHSVTLALSALGIFSLTPQIVEPGIALSIVFTLWWHLRSKSPRPWRPAFAFGLLHGFGFAGVLGGIGLPPQAKATALLSFNLGVEAGQLAFVLPVLILAWLALRLFKNNQWELRVRTGTVVAAVGLAAFSNAAMTQWISPAEGELPYPFLWQGGLALALTVFALPFLSKAKDSAPSLRSAATSAWALYALFILGQQLGAGWVQ